MSRPHPGGRRRRGAAILGPLDAALELADERPGRDEPVVTGTVGARREFHLDVALQVQQGPLGPFEEDALSVVDPAVEKLLRVGEKRAEPLAPRSALLDELEADLRSALDGLTG